MAGKAIHSNVDLITKGKLVVEKLGRAATLNEFVAAGVCSHQTLERRFGGIVKFNELCGAAGADPRPEFDLNAIRAERRDRSSSAALKTENKLLHARVDLLENQLSAFAEECVTKARIQPIQAPARGAGKDIAVFVGLWSDWHVEEVVDPDTVDGKNAHDLEIADSRAQRAHETFVRAVEISRASGAFIDTAVLFLGGDWITNNAMHPEFAQTCALGPAEAMDFAEALLRRGIEFILKYGKLRHLVVVCSYGNHDRTTDKMEEETAYKNSHATAMYKRLRDSFDDERVEWIIPKSVDVVIPILGFAHRFTHGHKLGGAGRGVDGLSAPFKRYVVKLNETAPAIYTAVGHVHTCGWYTWGGISNGSGLGWNAFAKNCGFKYEEPKQAGYLIDERRGLTITIPMYLDGRNVKFGGER